MRWRLIQAREGERTFALVFAPNDEAYYRAHSERSARIVGSWLREQHAELELIADVEALIRAVESERLPPSPHVVGVDMGLSSFLTTSNGEKVDNPRFYRRDEVDSPAD